MQKQLKEQEPKEEDDWGRPPAPDTPENPKKGNESSDNTRYFWLHWYFTARDSLLGLNLNDAIVTFI